MNRPPNPFLESVIAAIAVDYTPTEGVPLDPRDQPPLRSSVWLRALVAECKEEGKNERDVALIVMKVWPAFRKAERAIEEPATPRGASGKGTSSPEPDKPKPTLRLV